MKRITLPIVVCLLCTLFPPLAAAIPFSGLYVFGDSLSDAGNLSLATGGAIPGAPYYQGRFSNGPVYADRLAARLGFGLTPSLAGGNDFAFGGARTSYHPSGQPFDLLSQVSGYTGGVATADPGALYVVFAGANNLQDAIADPSNAGAIVSSAVNDLGTAIGALANKGAQHVLVPNAPDLGRIPRVRELEGTHPGISAFATQLSASFNAGLDALLNNLVGLDIIRLDTSAYLNHLVDNPADLGLTNTDARCYTGDDLTFTGGGTVCTDPNSYLFWDGIHPTAVVHADFGERAYRASVPEPASISLLALGLLLIAVESNRKAAPGRNTPDS